MCGIAGMAALNGTCSLRVVEAMCHAMTHRGPDSGGTVERHVGRMGVALGARRLSILDLSPAGNQPMETSDGAVSLVYNGEIYNHAELRHELLGRGYSFRSGSDTETVLNAYHAWGLAGLARLDGMFALALFDRRSARLTLARDRMGIKPLYYHWNGQTLRFASELKVLLLDPQIERQLDRDALDLYLTFGYVPSPYTLIAGVRKLQPGKAMVVSPSGLDEHVFRRWQAPNEDQLYAARSEPSQVRERVERAVRRQLVSDVPVGVLLSGGIDSSIVATVAAEGGPNPLHTFTAAYRAQDGVGGELAAYNEDSAVARQVADRLGTRHHEVVLDTRVEWDEELPRLAAQLDEPLYEPVYLVLHLLCAEARRHGVPVLLTGDGADELFHGYSARYEMPSRAAKYRWIPAARQLASVAANLAPGAAVRRQASGVHRVLGARNGAQRYLAYTEIFGARERTRLLATGLGSGHSDALAEHVVADALRPAAAFDLPQQLAFTDLRLWVGEHFNPRLDRIAMMHSVEARVPFQDDALVDEFVWTNPRENLRNGFGKRLLRDAFADRLPADVLQRRKRPFQAPGGALVREGMRQVLPTLLASGRLQKFGALDPSATDDIVNQALAEGEAQSFKIWTLIALQLWCEAFLVPSPLTV